MSRLKRSPVNKYKSSKKFRKNVSKTKGGNIRPTIMRGGYRL
ncbi:MAG: hypothetical protein [Microvirus sp.]|nr:MAG: hypothetical protein [Microvirus sp.]